MQLDWIQVITIALIQEIHLLAYWWFSNIKYAQRSNKTYFCTNCFKQVIPDFTSTCCCILMTYTLIQKICLCLYNYVDLNYFWNNLFNNGLKQYSWYINIMIFIAELVKTLIDEFVQFSIKCLIFYSNQRSNCSV